MKRMPTYLLVAAMLLAACSTPSTQEPPAEEGSSGIGPAPTLTASPSHDEQDCRRPRVREPTETEYRDWMPGLHHPAYDVAYAQDDFTSPPWLGIFMPDEGCGEAGLLVTIDGEFVQWRDRWDEPWRHHVEVSADSNAHRMLGEVTLRILKVPDADWAIISEAIDEAYGLPWHPPHPPCHRCTETSMLQLFHAERIDAGHAVDVARLPDDGSMNWQLVGHIAVLQAWADMTEAHAA